MTTSYRDGLLLEEYLAPHLDDFNGGVLGADELYSAIISDIEKLDSDYRDLFSSLPADEGIDYTEKTLKHMQEVEPENIVKAVEIIVDQLMDDEDISIEEQEENSRILAAQMYTDGELHDYMTQIDRDRYSVLSPQVIQPNIRNPRILSKFADGLLARARLEGYDQLKLYDDLDALKSLVANLPDKSEQGTEFTELKLMMAALPERIMEESFGYKEKIAKLNEQASKQSELILKLKERIEVLSRAETQEADLEEKLAALEARDLTAQGRIRELESERLELQTKLKAAEAANVITNTVWGKPETVYSGWVKIGNELYYGGELTPIRDAPYERVKELARVNGLGSARKKETLVNKLIEYFTSD